MAHSTSLWHQSWFQQSCIPLTGRLLPPSAGAEDHRHPGIFSRADLWYSPRVSTGPARQLIMLYVLSGSRLQLPELLIRRFSRSPHMWKSSYGSPFREHSTGSAASQRRAADTGVLPGADFGSRTSSGKHCCAFQLIWPRQQRPVTNSYNCLGSVERCTTAGSSKAASAFQI